MRIPGPDEIIRVWEQGQRQHPLDRALTILEPFTGKSRGELARLSMGGRDRMLLEARASIFGNRLDGFAQCTECGARLEFAMGVRDLELDAGDSGIYTLALKGQLVRFRLPNSSDLAQSLACRDADSARRLLLDVCVIEAPEGASREEIVEEMARIDRAADIEVRLECANCSKAWTVHFDISVSFWAELAAYAKRLLREVDLLARRYGWSEPEILSLGVARRRFYVELASA